MAIGLPLNVAERAATVVLGFSSGVMVLKTLWLNEVIAPFPWLAKLSPTGDSVLTSLIAGSLFFLVVNILFERSEFSRVRPVLAMRFKQVAGQYEGMIREMAGSAGVPIPDDAFETDIDAILTQLNPNAASNILSSASGPYLTWIGAMQHYTRRARKFAGMIERRANLLRSESLELLDRVHDNAFFGLIDSVSTPITNADLTFLSSTLSRYRDLMREVRAHAERL